MYKQESAVLTAKALCNLNIQRALYRQCCASHDSGKAWNSKDHYRDQYVDDTRAKDCYDCDCKQDVREAEQNVGTTHNQHFNNAAVVTCHQTQNSTQCSTDYYCRQGNTQCQSGTYQHTAEDISAIVVGSKNMLWGWSGQNIHIVIFVVIIRCNGWSNNCDNNQQKNDD